MLTEANGSGAFAGCHFPQTQCKKLVVRITDFWPIIVEVHLIELRVKYPEI